MKDLLMPKTTNCRVTHRRAGTTLLEVMFAIFVVTVGLLGIASILPLAARNASDSNAHNNAQALGQRWFQNFSAFGLNEPNAFTASRNGYDWIWFNGGVPRGYQRNSTGGLTTSAWINQSICIDPMFFTEREVRRLNGGGVSPFVTYQTGVFPYYVSNYDPTTNSLADTPPFLERMQPRMLRTTLGRVLPPSLLNPARIDVLSRKLVEDIFASTDDIAASADETDKTIPAFRVWAEAAPGQTNPLITKGLVTGQYSWLATLAPIEPIRNAALASLPRDYLLSLVVMNRRDRQFDPGSAGGTRPLGERLVQVQPLTDRFQNGTGGRIRVSGHWQDPSSDRLHVGDWIMLSTNVPDARIPGELFAVFRWYRIIGLSQETQLTGTENTTWSRDVVLEGPDFVFGRDIQGTLMSGVVTVVERNISIK